MKTRWETIAFLFAIIIAAGCVSKTERVRQESNQKSESVKPVAPLTPPQTSAPPVQQKASDIDPAESAQWDRATEPLSLAEVQRYIDRYPGGKYANDAKQIIDDEKVIEDIEMNGVGTRFVVPPDSLPEFVVTSSAYNKEQGRTIMREVSSGLFASKTVFGHISWQLPTFVTSPREFLTQGFRGPFLPCGDRSVFVVNGTIQNIVGDPRDPIRFVYSVSRGLVHIAGKGKVLDREGKVLFQTP